MYSTSLQCFVCLQTFDLQTHLPKILPLCGHTVCIDCLRRLLQMPAPKCPFDNKRFPVDHNSAELFPTNFSLKDLIEEGSEWKLCTIHGENAKLACFTDKSIICAYCVLYGDHKEHQVKPVSEIKVELDSKRKSLEDLLTKLDKHHKSMDFTLEQKKGTVLRIVEENFTKLVSILKKKKDLISVEVNKAFSEKRGVLESTVGSKSAFRESLLQKIALCKAKLKKNEVFQLLEEDLSQFTVDFDDAFFLEHAQKFNANLTQDTQGFQKMFSSQLEFINESQILDASMVDHFKGFDIRQDCDNLALKLCSDLVSLQVKSCLDIICHHECLDIKGTNRKPINLSLDARVWQNIKQIKIKLDKFAFATDDIILLNHICSKISEVHSITIVAEWQHNMPDQYLLQLFSAIFAKPKKLKEIELNFCLSKIGDASLVFLSESVIPQIEELKCLKLDLWQTKITDKTLHVFAEKALPYLTNLNTFKLNLNKTVVTEAGIERIFVNMPSIVNFELHLLSIAISDRCIDTLIKNMLSSMQNLESFDLKLQDTKITDYGVIVLVQSLSHVKKGKINLESTKITNKSAEAFLLTKLSAGNGFMDFEFLVSNTQVTEDVKARLNQCKTKIVPRGCVCE